MWADAVFQGGGIRGIALVGAIQVAEENGYQWKRLAGTSSGAIVASLLAAGCTVGEMRRFFHETDFTSFMKRSGWFRLPGIGLPLQLLLKKGLYSTGPLEDWLAKRLAERGVRTFSDLEEERLHVVATDITSGDVLVIPKDLQKYGLRPEDFPVAKAVAMSCAIPYYYQPVRLRTKKGTYMILDGALLSNYPVWLFDAKDKPRWPTFGFRLISDKWCKPHPTKTLFQYTHALTKTMIGAMDHLAIREADAVRTIFINTHHISATDFTLSMEEMDELYQSGRRAAEAFFRGWDFAAYCLKYRPRYQVNPAHH